MKSQCAWYKRFKQKDGSYDKKDPDPNDKIVSHGMCVDCYKKLNVKK